jgi:GNAT superfamily N-acetyltransferase
LKQEDETLLFAAQKPAARAFGRRFTTLRLEILAVRQQFQRQGYGTRLLASSIDEFQRLIDTVGALVMTLECVETVDPAFYENFGFERYGPASRTPKMLLPWMSVIDAYSDD